jgi:quercetin 2,3-dioxygenase
MRRIRTARDRGLVRDPGGERRCAFSSGDFHDPAWTGFGALRVLNELRLVAGAAPAHPRANMEELGYLMSGALECGEADGQRVSLDPGALYSTGAGHGAEAGAAGWIAGPGGAVVLQAWIQPDRVNAAPSQGWRPATKAAPGWRCLASPDGAAGTVPIRQQVWLRSVSLAPGGSDALDLDPERRYWLQVVEGPVAFGDTPLAAGDALALTGEAGTLAMAAGGAGAMLLVFDLPD